MYMFVKKKILISLDNTGKQKVTGGEGKLISLNNTGKQKVIGEGKQALTEK